MNLSIASGMRPGTTVTDKNAEGSEMFSRAWYKKIKESGEETDCIYKLNDRILLAKDLRVEKQLGPECVEVFHTELRDKFLLQKLANSAENISKWINCPTHSNIVTAFHQFEDLDYRIRVTQPANDDQTINEFKGNATYEKTKGKFILVEPSNFGTLYGFINRLGQIIDDQVRGKMIEKFKRAFYSEKERMKYKHQGQIKDVHVHLIYQLQAKLRKDKRQKPTDEEIYKIYEEGRYVPSNKPIRTPGKTPSKTVEEEDDEEAPKERAKIDFRDDIIFKEYIKFVYNIAIQLSQGLDHAHSNNLYHGQLDTSRVKVHRIELPEKIKHKQTNDTQQSQVSLQSQSDINKNLPQVQKQIKNYMYHFKISEFTPIESIMLMKSEVFDKDIKWDFEPKKKDEIQPKDVIEDLKFKDIYCLGVCLMELMVGRFGKQNTVVSLDQIPEVWSREPQCLALYEALRDCLEINSSTQREGRLKDIRLRLTESYKTFFYMKEDALLSEPYVSVQAHVKNKLGLMQLFQMKDSNVNDDKYEIMAKKYFKMALHLQKDNFNAAFNLGFLRFTRGQDGVDAGNFITTLNNCENPGHGGKLAICFQMAQTGDCQKAIEELADYISELDGSKAKAEESLIVSVSKEQQKIKKPPKIDYKKLKEAEDLKKFIETSKNDGFFPENIKFKHEQTTPLKSLSFSSSDKFLVSLDEKSVAVWEIKLSQAQKYIQFDLSGNPIIATINDSASLVGVLSKDQNGHSFKIFETENGKLVTTLSNPPSIPINELDNKPFTVLDLRFVEEEEKFSLYVRHGNENLNLQYYEITYKKEQKVLNVQQKKSNNLFDDRTPNNFNLPEKVKSFVSQKEKEARDQELVQKQKVQRLIKDNFNNQIGTLVESNQNIPISVPTKSDNLFAYYLKDETAIYVFNCKRNRNVRFYYQGTESFKAFSLSNSAKYLAYFDSHYIKLETVQLMKPNTESIRFEKYAKYRYVRADDQVKSGETNKQKTTLKERMVRDIRNYQIFQESIIRVREEMLSRGQKVDENSNEFKNKVKDLGASLTQGFIPEVVIEMMLYKYNIIINKPALIKMNKEFTIMQKILMQESKHEFDKPLEEIWQRYSMETYKAQKRIDVYDSEIPFPPNTEIIDVQMSSEPLQNFMLVLVGKKSKKQDFLASQIQLGNMSQINADESENSGKVYKFDLNTRELIFQFDALINPIGLILFDNDDKLLVYNSEEIQIWDFDNSGQGLPQLIDDACYLGDTNKLVQESTTKIDAEKGKQLVVDKVYMNENCEGDSLVLVDFNEVVYLYRSPRESDDFMEEEGKMKIDVFSNPADKRKIESVNFSQDSSIIYIGDSDGFIHFIDSNSGQYYLNSQPFDTKANWPSEVVDWLRNDKERKEWQGQSDYDEVRRSENQLVSYSQTKVPPQPKPRFDTNQKKNTAVTMIQRFGLYNKKGYEIYLVVIGEQVPLILDMFAKFDNQRKKITSIAPKLKAFSFGETYRPIRDRDSTAYLDPKYNYKDKNLENQIQLGKYFRNYSLAGDEIENHKPLQEQFKICQAQIALNCQFFVIGFAKDVTDKEIKLADHFKAVEPHHDPNQSQFLQFNNSSAAKRPPATGMVKSKPSNLLSPHEPARMETASNYLNNSLVPNFQRPETGIGQNMGRPLSGKSNISAVTKKTIKEKREQKEKENNSKKIKANSGLGIWFFDCDDQKIEQRKWILEVDFINFSVDDHLATVCFWLRDNKSLDLQYMLWEFGPDANYDGPNKIDWNKVKEIDEGHTKDQPKAGACGQTKEKGNDQEEDEDDDDDEVEIEELLKMEAMGTRLNASKLCNLF